MLVLLFSMSSPALGKNAVFLAVLSCRKGTSWQL
jgi:hypothetical protein